MILTRPTIRGFEVGEEFLNVAALPSLSLFESLPDPFTRVRASGDIEQTLVGFRVLHHRRGFTLDSEDYRSFAFSELFHEIV
jgi:hypothetical protein